MNIKQKYTIAGGLEGRERLKVVGRVCRADTLNFLNAMNISQGSRCADIGCGGGDVSIELANMVGETGSVDGFDADHHKLKLAEEEVKQKGFNNVNFTATDVELLDSDSIYDLVYSRFLFSHLSEPERILKKMVQAAKPGGIVALEDIDFSSYLCYPQNDSVDTFAELYRLVVRKTGADPHIGQRLPSLMREAGIVDIHINLAQPVQGEAKQLMPLSLESIRESLLSHQLIEEPALNKTIEQLYEFANDPDTVLSVPRTVQVFGRKIGQ